MPILSDAGETILDDAGEIITIGDPVTIPSDDYLVGSGEQWKFALYGTLLIATNVVDGPQKFDLTTSANFEVLGGSPPAARYIDIVREFVFLGAIANNEKRVQWSAIGDAEGWTAGTNESDYQDFPNGGPVRGIIGGGCGYSAADLCEAQTQLRAALSLPEHIDLTSFDPLEVAVTNGGSTSAADKALALSGGPSIVVEHRHTGGEQLEKFKAMMAEADDVFA